MHTSTARDTPVIPFIRALDCDTLFEDESAWEEIFLKKRLSLVFSLWVMSLILGVPAFAEPVAGFLPHSATEKYILGAQLEILEDPSSLLNIEDFSVENPNHLWVKSQAEVPSFGYTSSSYWFRLRLLGPLPPGPWIFEISYPPLDHISFYSRTGDGPWLSKQSGDQFQFHQRDMNYRNPTFVVSAGEIKEVYIRVKSMGVLKMPLTLWHSGTFTEQATQATLAYGLYFGIMLVMVLYNLFIYISIRQVSYLYYVLYIASYGLAMFALNGFAFQYMWPSRPELNSFMVPVLEALSLGTLAVFMASYLSTRKQTPRLHFVLNMLMIYSLATVASAFILGYDLAIKMVTFGVLFFVVFVFIASIVRLRMGYRPAKYFLIAFSSMLIGTFLFALASAGLLPSNFITDNGLQIGSLMEVVLLSLGLADRIKLDQEQADAINIKLIKSLKQSEQEQIENRIKIERLNENLIEKDRARTIFFQNTSHELRTPLNGVIGYIDLLQRGHYGETRQEMLEKLEKVRSLTESLKLQVNTILDLAKSQTGTLKLNSSRIPLDEIKEEAIVLAESLQIRRPNLFFQSQVSWLPSERPIFINDHDHLMTIIRNLLGNAFKFHDRDRPNHVQMDLESKAECLIIRISDTGLGIAEENHQRIFEEFKQVDEGSRRSFEGTGLGLAMVKQIVDLMQGSIHVQSQLGQGSTFTVTLPEQLVVQLERPRATPDQLGSIPLLVTVDLSKPAEVAQTGTIAVLAKTLEPFDIVVIDDNDVNCDVIEAILSHQHYPVEIFTDSREGLARIKRQKPDLLLLDLMMPGLSGEDILLEIRQSPELRNIPVILLTARASQEDRLLGLAMGADDYMAKPLLSEEVVLRVRNTLSRTSLARETAARLTIESTLAEAQAVYKALGYDATGVPGVEIAYHFQPAEMTGGDWFGVQYDESSQRLYSLVGDVTGHGVPAALITIAVAGAIKGALSVICQQGLHASPNQALKELYQAANEVVLEASHKMDRGMTMFFSCLDMQSGEFTYLNAGHLPPFLIGKEKNLSLVQPGTPLGYGTNHSMETRMIKLNAGEGLLLFTDGLIENQGPEGQVLNHKALGGLLAYDQSPQELKSKILQTSEAICKQHPLGDDCTFLLLRWRAVETKQQAS